MKFAPTLDMISAAETVFLAKAHLALVEPIVLAYKRDILARHKWMTAPHLRDDSDPELVVDPKDAYMLSDADFAVYDAECNAARVMAGLHVEKPEFCPLLVAEDHVRQAERALVEAMAPTTGMDSDKLFLSGMANYRKFVDLSLRVMAPFVDRDSIMSGLGSPATRSAGSAEERPTL